MTMDWQPAETAPRDGTVFLAWYADESYELVSWVDDERNDAVGFTFWCALVAPQ